MPDRLTQRGVGRQEPRRTGMAGFTIVWVGQVVSLLGSGMTWFALTIWAWEVTGTATALALVAFFSFGPTVLLSPIAGVVVDRWNRKLIMIASDAAAGLMTVFVLLLHATGHLQVWHLYATGAIAGAFQALQFPAYSAAVTTMLPKEQYGRANGMLSLAESAGGVFAPLAGGILLGIVGLGGILVIEDNGRQIAPSPLQTDYVVDTIDDLANGRFPRCGLGRFMRIVGIVRKQKKTRGFFRVDQLVEEEWVGQVIQELDEADTHL